MVGSDTDRPEHDGQTSEQLPGDEGRPDIFERRDSVDSETERAAHNDASTGAPSGGDVSLELPVELASLSDRYIPCPRY